MKPFLALTSRVVPLPVEDVDTDQIIPARFLKATSREGLGEQLFYDWRYDSRGAPRPDFILNRRGLRDAAILAAGRNFGCGSSREHAPWALLQFGFRAVVSSAFGDIFRQNALKNGLLPVQVSTSELTKLFQAVDRQPDLRVTINLPQQCLSAGDLEFFFPIDAFSRTCLLKGLDQLEFILAQEEAISRFEQENPPAVRTTAFS
ncbi:MAG: 3-isopropylmalate dehydratase small subunit [Acidobacteriota bacterium]